MMKLKLLSSKKQFLIFFFPFTSFCLVKAALSRVLCLLFLFRQESETNLKGILGYTEDDVVSTDFVGDCR